MPFLPGRRRNGTIARTTEESSMRRLCLMLSGAVAALVVGCATPGDIDTFEAPGGNLAAKQAFYFKGVDFATAAQLDAATIAAADSHVRAAIVGELTHGGYVEKPQAEGADFTVTALVSGVRRFETLEAPRVGAPSPNQVLTPGQIRPPPASSVPREITIREGSMVLLITDNATGKLLWRGETRTESRASNAEQATRTLTQMARNVATQVPRHAGQGR
jgi:hypothetical protein